MGQFHACRDMEAAPGLMLRIAEEHPAKFARASSESGKSTNRHIQTEQRRRDRINEGWGTSLPVCNSSCHRMT